MSYPFQGGSHNHPYPPNLSYPSAPPENQAYPHYPPQTTQPGYSPYPPQSAYTPYPPSAGSTPYPPLSGSSPYPPLSGSTPYPPSAGSSPYPPLSGSSPYPPLSGSSPYPPLSGSSPYPPSAGSTPYPPSAGSTPYPPSAGSTPYPPLSGSTPYPPSAGSSAYPPLSGSSPYPPSAAFPSHQSPYPPQATHPIAQPGGYPPEMHHGGSGHHHHHQGMPSQPTFKGHPTVKPANPFNPQADAEVLRKAMKGFGTDEAAIIAVLSKRTNAQRLEIALQYKALYGKDLVSNLKSETSGKFEQLIVALMTPIHEFYAQEVKHAISGIGTDESTLIEVLCTLSNAELHYIKTAYEKLYNSSMESDLRGDTSGSFKRLLTSLCQGRRDENNVVNPAAAEADAQALLRAGELRFGTDESTFNAILCTRSFAQLNAIFAAYERLTGHPFEKAVKSEFSGDIEDGLLAIVESVRNRQGFLATCLYKSMAGAGTNDRALIRLIVTRSEIDLETIKREFAAKYGKTLDSFIKGDASGDYKKLLIALQE